MNSLNILSSRVIGQTPLGSRPRSRSQAEVLRSKTSDEGLRGRSYSEERIARLAGNGEPVPETTPNDSVSDGTQTPVSEVDDDRQPLLRELVQKTSPSYGSSLRQLLKRIADALTAVFSIIGLPVVYVAGYFQNEEGRYSPLVPFRRTRNAKPSNTRTPVVGSSELKWNENPGDSAAHIRRQYSSESLSSNSSESDNDQDHVKHATTPKTSESDDEPKARRQSARIRLLHNEEAVQKRKQKVAQSDRLNKTELTPLSVDSLKSPISTSSSLRVTKYPHAPQPPRPLVPRRQPSYSNFIPRSPSRLSSPALQQKTLVLDLDETLIHSMAKGGRMSTGHMVEVKLNVPVSLSPSQTGQPPPAVIGPQHPILYYVHKRPYCDEFLRKVCKWYKLVVFTASVQEYADPVINWLETERKYFSGRYYRQHCTFRNGSYIKDLSSIEPDLSKVIILDNSPVSYIFHEDNAIPIEGWINDPTDNDLLYLIPMLEALQYVNDVRALLALRRGEAEAA